MKTFASKTLGEAKKWLREIFCLFLNFEVRRRPMPCEVCFFKFQLSQEIVFEVSHRVLTVCS